MSMRHAAVAEIVRRDPRFAYEAYEFLFAALHHTQKRLGRLPRKTPLDDAPANHVRGRQLLDGLRDLALREFGLMARTVFRCWGINRTDDVGAMVFNLVEAELMSKTAEDSHDDFHDVFDLDQVLQEQAEIKLDEVE